MSTHITISREGQQFGPYSVAEVTTHLETGAIVADDWAWTEGMVEWRPLKDVVNIATEETEAPPETIDHIEEASIPPVGASDGLHEPTHVPAPLNQILRFPEGHFQPSQLEPRPEDAATVSWEELTALEERPVSVVELKFTAEELRATFNSEFPNRIVRCIANGKGFAELQLIYLPLYLVKVEATFTLQQKQRMQDDAQQVPCPMCHGHGRMPFQNCSCSYCNGNGSIWKRPEYWVPMDDSSYETSGTYVFARTSETGDTAFCDLSQDALVGILEDSQPPSQPPNLLIRQPIALDLSNIVRRKVYVEVERRVLKSETSNRKINLQIDDTRITSVKSVLYPIWLGNCYLNDKLLPIQFDGVKGDFYLEYATDDSWSIAIASTIVTFLIYCFGIAGCENLGLAAFIVNALAWGIFAYRTPEMHWMRVLLFALIGFVAGSFFAMFLPGH